MIIQFNPSAADPESSVESPDRPSSPLNWRPNKSSELSPDGRLHSDGTDSNVVDLEMVAYPQELTLSSSYIEEVKAKRFKGSNSVALHLAEELVGTTREGRDFCDPDLWPALAVFYSRCDESPGESLPDAA